MCLVQKCCCFDLKYGYAAYAVMCMVSRFSMAFCLYFLAGSLDVLLKSNPDNELLSLVFKSFMGYAIGWSLATAFLTLLALKGIFEEKSALIFPCLVVAMYELVQLAFSVTSLACRVSPAFVFAYIVVGIYAYPIVCLMSVYRKVRTEENVQYNKLERGIRLENV